MPCGCSFVPANHMSPREGNTASSRVTPRQIIEALMKRKGLCPAFNPSSMTMPRAFPRWRRCSAVHNYLLDIAFCPGTQIHHPVMLQEPQWWALIWSSPLRLSSCGGMACFEIWIRAARQSKSFSGWTQRKKRKVKGGANLHKSLAWENAFSNVEGLFEIEELGTGNGTFHKMQGSRLLPGIVEEIRIWCHATSRKATGILQSHQILFREETPLKYYTPLIPGCSPRRTPLPAAKKNPSMKELGGG